jgi:prephenate dehydrogenase
MNLSIVRLHAIFKLMNTVGIIGFGSFGQFLAEKLEPYVNVKISSRNPSTVPLRWKSTLNEIASCDYIIPAIPLDSYKSVLSELKPNLQPNAVIVDVCSVKIIPCSIISEVLPNAKLVATHPLFGPESAAKSLIGHTFVICRDVSDPIEVSKIIDFANIIGLNVVEKTTIEHDKEMAIVHALTFFIAQGLVNDKIHDASLHTPSFQKLLSLAELERHHSDDLFKTIQQGNPYAAEARQKFVDELLKINAHL